MGARGLIVQLLSLPGYWTLYKSELENYNKNGRTSIDTAIAELTETGYLTVTKESDQTLTYKVNEVPDGTIGIHEMYNAQNMQCDVQIENSDAQNDQDQCTNHPSDDAQNVQLLNNNLNTIKLTTTKAVSQSLFSNEELKKSIEETYGFTFSEDFYSKLLELNEERGINPLEYADWLINQKGKNAASVSNYVYKAAGNLNIINEYCRYKKEQENIRKTLFEPKETVVCPECNHKFQSIDFITRKCQCGLSLNEIMARKGGSNE